jgi:hypothetical protein
MGVNYYIKNKALEITPTGVPTGSLTEGLGYASIVTYLDGKTANYLSAGQYASLSTDRFTTATAPF